MVVAGHVDLDMSASTEELGERLDRKIEASKRRRRRGWTLVAAIAVGTFALVLGGTYLVLDALDRRADAEALARVRAAGDPTTPEEMNAFVATSPAIETATERWMTAIAAEKRSREWPGYLSLPLIGNSKVPPVLDARGLYAPATVAAIRPYLNGPATSQALAAAQSAREAGAVARFPIDWERGHSIELSHDESLRALANLIALEARVCAAEGDLVGATDSLLGIVATGEALSNEPTAVSFLTRIACTGMARQEVMTLIPCAPWPEDQLARLQAALARQRLHGEMLRAARGEQYQLIRLFEDRAPTGDAFLDRAKSLPFRGSDRAEGLSWMQDYLADAKGGYADAQRAAQAISNRQASYDPRLVGFRYGVSAYSTSPQELLVHAALRAESEFRVAEAYLACRRYRMRNGVWPPTLDAIAPEFASAVPSDPWSQTPLDYVVEGESIAFHVHSGDLSDNRYPASYRDAAGRYIFSATHEAGNEPQIAAPGESEPAP